MPGILPLSGMRHEIYFGTGQRNEILVGTAAGNAFLGARAREAYTHVCSPKVYDHPVFHNLQQDFTLGSGTNENHNVESFALPARLRAVELVRDETNGLRYDPDRFDQFMDRGAAPRQWARRGMRLYVPTSEATTGHTLRVHYWGRPLPLVLDAQVTEIGEEWDPIIVELAISFTFTRLNQPALADEHRALAAALIADQVDERGLEAQISGWQSDLSQNDPYQERS